MLRKMKQYGLFYISFFLFNLYIQYFVLSYDFTPTDRGKFVPVFN